MRRIEVRESRYAWNIFVNDDIYYFLDKELACETIRKTYNIANDSIPDIDIIKKAAGDYAEKISNHKSDRGDLTANECDVLRGLLAERFTHHFNIERKRLE